VSIRVSEKINEVRKNIVGRKGKYHMTRGFGILEAIDKRNLSLHSHFNL
jgi:hypothetical protein